MSGYAEDRFTNDMKLFLCNICQDVCNQTSVLTCGHLFCKGCIEKAKEFQDRCPSCRKSPMGEIYPSPWHIQQINGSTATCEYCDRKDAFERILEHQKECPNQPIPYELCST